jgi:hypothetical protein
LRGSCFLVELVLKTLVGTLSIFSFLIDRGIALSARILEEARSGALAATALVLVEYSWSFDSVRCSRPGTFRDWAV